MQEKIKEIKKNPFYQGIIDMIIPLLKSGESKIHLDKDFYKIKIQSIDNYPISFWFGVNKEENKFFFSLGEVFHIFYYDEIENLQMSNDFKKIIKRILNSEVREQIKKVDGKIQQRKIEVVYEKNVIENLSYKYFLSLFRRKAHEENKYQPWLSLK